jgi:O-antigen ligase
MIKKNVQFLQTFLIACFFISIPVTNFPFFPPSFGGNSAYVKPLLVFPLLGLVALVTLPRMIKRPLPRAGILLIIFFLWSVVSSLVPLLRLTSSPWREVSLIPREIRTLITLGLACAIYFTVALYPKKQSDLAQTLRWLYIGLAVVLFWGSLQALYVLDLIPNWYEVMSRAQQYITSRKLNPSRVSGMTYEPSSFADQIITIWLPWVYAALLTDFTVFPWRWKWLTIEKVLFAWTFAVLAATLSRTGLIMGVGVLIFGAVLSIVRGWFRDQQPSDAEDEQQDRSSSGRFSLNWKIGLLVLLGLAVFVGLFIFIGSGSGYISRMWKYWFADSNRSLAEYLIYIGFGSRITYWRTAFRIFEAYPIFGVGLGNYTLLFPAFIPPQQLIQTPQVLRHLVPAAGRTRVITSKHFAARILAETGLVGGAIFLVFLLILAAGGLYLWLSNHPQKKFWGTGSLLGLAAFAGVTFSFDSFAIPNPWILFGLVTAGFAVFRREETAQPSSPTREGRPSETGSRPPAAQNRLP